MTIGKLPTNWINDVKSNLDGSDTTINDLMDEYLNKIGSEIDRNGNVWTGTMWLPELETEGFMSWVDKDD